MPRKTLQLQFPRLGVIRRFGLQFTGNKGEFSTPWSINTRLEDSLTNRLRGGSWTAPAPSTTSDAEQLLLVTENGDTIVTENGDSIGLGLRYEIAAGDGRKWASTGSSAPTSGTVDCLYRDRVLRVDDTNSQAIAAKIPGYPSC